MLDSMLTQFKIFREQLFQYFSNRSDATMELIDALSSNQHANSITGLCLNQPFRRKYGSINDAIVNFNKDPEQIKNIEIFLRKQCESISPTRPYHLLGVDCTSAPRQYSKTLSDKGIVHKPTATPGNKPITVGHQYSVMGFFPERPVGDKNTPWVLPLSTRRVATNSNGISIGIEQLNSAMSSFKNRLTVNVADSAYSCPKYIEATHQHDNLVLIARLRNNRVLYNKAVPKAKKITGRRERGHELWYGEAFKLNDQSTWRKSDEEVSEKFITRKGKTYTVHIQAWRNILMRQKDGVRLNEFPFGVLRVYVTDEKNNLVYKRPMWLMISGKRQSELNLLDIWKAYKQRFDIEHFFKFGKNRLLMDKFQTPETAHEESWWQIASLAYAQLYMVRKIANNIPTPWEKYLPEMQKNETVKSARQVQKSFLKITHEIGTPASPPKPRGKPLGRQKGDKQIKREHKSIVIKADKSKKQAAA